ncbi:MAG: hypothetical protein NZM11_10740, partial [Anaerolineales bacterium]|nr:hypothetical protein [Anaerolineales bacterium]
MSIRPEMVWVNGDAGLEHSTGRVQALARSGTDNHHPGFAAGVRVHAKVCQETGRLFVLRRASRSEATLRMLYAAG